MFYTWSQFNNTLDVAPWNSKSGKPTFQYHGAFHWNALPSDVHKNIVPMLKITTQK